MNNEKLIELAQREQDKLIETIRKTKADAENYDRLWFTLSAAVEFEMRVANDEFRRNRIGTVDCPVVESITTAPAKADTETAAPPWEESAEVYSSVQGETEMNSATANDKTADERKTPELTKEKVRDLLTEASQKGVQLQPIISRFVPEGKPVKFSEIPAAKYPELVEALNHA